MRKVGVLLVILFCTSLHLFSFNNVTISEDALLKINSGWKFKLLKPTNSENKFESILYNDAGWQTVSLPHTANVEPLLVNNQWQGICWYRKTIDFSKKYKGKKVFIEFEAAMNFSKIWINGILVSEHQGGYLPIVIEASKYLKCNAQNVIAVRLDNTDNVVTGPKPLERLDFNMYGGLYRKANVYVKEKIYISNPTFANKIAGGGVFITYPKVSEEKSIVNIKTHLINETKKQSNVEVLYEVFYKDKLIKEVKTPSIIKSNSDIQISANIELNDVKLWSPKSPNLYTLVTTILTNGKEIDTETTRFGIRSFVMNNNKLYINGEKTFLRGVNRHQEYPFIGYALSDNAQYRDAKKIKDAGFDYIRLSHYPQSPAFMDACDELGLVVADAILGWQYYGDNDAFRNYCYESARKLIRRDRNHACVFSWEVSLNETQMPVFFMEKLNNIVHEEYPGENVYSCGWMHEVYDIYFQARQHRLLHPQKKEVINKKPYAVSEYGDWEYYSNNKGFNQDTAVTPKERLETCSRQLREAGEKALLYQVKNLQESHNDNLANTPAYADSYWVMYDYTRGYHQDIESSGVSDIFRIPKFGYYFYKSQRNVEEEKVIKIATYWNEDSPTNVKVLSNADKVKLYLNDELIAVQSPDKDSFSSHLNHPPFTFKLGKFTAGTLKAIGVFNNKEEVSDVVKTALDIKRLKIWIDESGKKPQAGVNDVVFVYIAAVDKNGTIVSDYSAPIGVNITGDAELMNLDSIVSEAGIATALIKIGDKGGEINIRARSNKKKGNLTFKTSIN